MACLTGGSLFEAFSRVEEKSNRLWVQSLDTFNRATGPQSDWTIKIGLAAIKPAGRGTPQLLPYPLSSSGGAVWTRWWRPRWRCGWWWASPPPGAPCGLVTGRGRCPAGSSSWRCRAERDGRSDVSDEIRKVSLWCSGGILAVYVHWKGLHVVMILFSSYFFFPNSSNS